MFSLVSVAALFVFVHMVPILTVQMAALTGERPRSSFASTQVVVGAMVVTIAEGLYGWPGALLAVVLWTIQWIDFNTNMIPDKLQAIGFIAAVLVNFRTNGFWQWNFLIALTVCLALIALEIAFARLTKRQGMGFGDVKYIGWLVILGGGAMIVSLVASACAFLIVRHFIVIADRRAAFPFAPVLTFGAILHYGRLAIG